MASSKGPSVQETAITTPFKNPQLPSIKHFRDIGKSINQIAQQQLLQENILYISSDLKEATPPENDYLRNTLNIRTVVDTAWETARVVMPNPNPDHALQQPQSWLNISNVLGLIYCGVKLRRGPYMEALSKEMSFWQKTKIYGAASFNENYTRMNTQLTQAAFAQGATKESLRVLEGSKAMIGEFFNKIFGEEGAFPIVMTTVRDSNLLIIVLLLFLEVPIEVLEREIELSVIDAQAGREVPDDEPGAKFQADYVKSAGSWAGEVEEWVVGKYGSVEGYLKTAGVSTKAQDAVERMLLAEAGEKLVEV